MAVKCRRASLKDIPLLVDMAREFHGQSPMSKFEFTPAGTKEYLINLLKDHASVIIMTSNGAISGSVSRGVFCDTIIAKENFWFVSDQAGKRSDGIALLNEYRKWLETKNVDFDLMSLIEFNSLDTDRVIKIMEWFGYDKIETTMMRIH